MDRAAVVQRVARLPFQAEEGGASPTPRLHFTSCTADETKFLLKEAHYLGPMTSCRYGFAGWLDGEMVACQLWRHPTARQLPDGLIELSRWCIAPDAPKNAGSRMMGWVRRQLRSEGETVGVSYSDLHRHIGALYRASGWEEWPTHIATRFLSDGIGFPSGNGRWTKDAEVSTPKMRWRIEL